MTEHLMNRLLIKDSRQHVSVRSLCKDLPHPLKESMMCQVLKRILMYQLRRIERAHMHTGTHKINRRYLAWNYVTFYVENDVKQSLKTHKSLVQTTQLARRRIGTTKTKKHFFFEEAGQLTRDGVGVFSVSRKGSLAFLSGNQDAKSYTRTMEDHLLLFMVQQHTEDCNNQQDGVSTQTANHQRRQFYNNNIALLPFPTRPLTLIQSIICGLSLLGNFKQNEAFSIIEWAE